jgi:hypothetical protein
MAMLLFSLAACESGEEKAERIRLEKIYAMDSKEIADAFDRGSLVEPYNSVNEECERERINKSLGKWCGKWAEVEAAYSPSFDFSRPKF